MTIRPMGKSPKDRRGTAYPETFPDFRRGAPRGRPSVASAARPGGRTLTGGETSKAAGAWPRLASSRPKSRRFAAVGLEMRLRARSCPCGAIHLQPPPYRFPTNFPGLGRGGPGGVRAKKSPSSVWPSGQPPSPWKGEGLSGRVWDPPLRRITKTVSRLRRGRSQTGPPGFVPGALAEKTQAQLWNRTGP